MKVSRLLSFPFSLFNRARLFARKVLPEADPPAPFRNTNRLATPHPITLYAIGDIHGRADLLERLHETIDTDIAVSVVDPSYCYEIYLGDYIDRGPNSRDVIDLLLSRSEDCLVVCLKGNHESLLLDVLEGRRPAAEWLNWGGAATALSYGLDPRQLKGNEQAWCRALENAIPPAHRQFLSELKTCLDLPPFFFCHAGVRPGVAIEDQAPEDLLWIRTGFLESAVDFGRIVVHGHTPSEKIIVRRNRICVDTGAYATGVLSCVRFDPQGLQALSIR